MEAFSWPSLARVTGYGSAPACEALFLRIGRLLGRDSERLEAFLHTDHPVHILAYVAAGLGAEHQLEQLIRPKLRGAIDALLGDENGVALGHALELADTMQQVGIPGEGERLARHALQILETLPRGPRDTYALVAQALLAGALAQQGRWEEILAFEPDRNAIVLSPQARFIQNMRAAALIELDRFADAERALRQLLDVDATNSLALLNLTALYLRAQDWPKAVEAAEHAKPLLSAEDLDRVLLNESQAREKLDDRLGALRALDELTGPLTTRDDVMKARERLVLGDRAAHPPAPETAAGATVEPRSPLAALLQGVETSTTNAEKGRSLEELMAALFATVPGFHVVERNLRTETEEIDLVVLNGSDHPLFLREEALLVVECKNWSKSCGKNEFVLFEKKVRNRSQRCSVGFLVSWNGFAETVTKEMLRGTHERTLIVPIAGDRVRRAVQAGRFVEELHAAWHEAVAT